MQMEDASKPCGLRLRHCRVGVARNLLLAACAPRTFKQGVEVRCYQPRLTLGVAREVQQSQVAAEISHLRRRQYAPYCGTDALTHASLPWQIGSCQTPLQASQYSVILVSQISAVMHHLIFSGMLRPIFAQVLIDRLNQPTEARQPDHAREFQPRK